MEQLLKSRYIDSEGCWLWTGEVNGAGYGWVYRPEFPKGIGVHRLSYLLNKGSLEPGMDVMHECDKKLCFNPKCLTLGTRSKNQRDARDRGLTSIKLSVTIAEEIRKRYRKGNISQSDLAREYKVTRQTIFQVVNNITWKME